MFAFLRRWSAERQQRRLRRNNVRADILLPGGIVVDMGRLLLFHLSSEVTLRLSEINGLSIANQGEEGFMENYMLAVETTRYDQPRLNWYISNSRRDAEQVARIIGDFLTGALMSADNVSLPASTRLLAS